MTREPVLKKNVSIAEACNNPMLTATPSLASAGLDLGIAKVSPRFDFELHKTSPKDVGITWDGFAGEFRSTLKVSASKWSAEGIDELNRGMTFLSRSMHVCSNDRRSGNKSSENSDTTPVCMRQALQKVCCRHIS